MASKVQKLKTRDRLQCRVCSQEISKSYNLQVHYQRQHKQIVIARTKHEDVDFDTAIRRIVKDHLEQNFAVIDNLHTSNTLLKYVNRISRAVEAVKPLINTDVQQDTSDSDAPQLTLDVPSSPQQHLVPSLPSNPVISVNDLSIPSIPHDSSDKTESLLISSPNNQQDSVKRLKPSLKTVKQTKLVSCLACEKMKEIIGLVEFGLTKCEEVIKSHCVCAEVECCCQNRLLSARQKP